MDEVIFTGSAYTAFCDAQDNPLAHDTNADAWLALSWEKRKVYYEEEKKRFEEAKAAEAEKAAETTQAASGGLNFREMGVIK